MTPASPRPVLTAWTPPGIGPIELWDAVVDGRSLFERRADSDFYEALVRAIPDEPRAVALVGGALDRTSAMSAFARKDRPLALVDDDPFFAASGAASDRAPIVIDAGQTSVKAVGPGGRARLSRAGDVALAALVASALDEVAGPAVDVLLAVPCAVSVDRGAIALGASSYPVRGDARAFADDVTRRARTKLRSIALTNDAVLAAHVARGRLRASEPALVLTIGHGVGAAILEGSS